MKITKLYISAFGGLKDFNIDFSDGFQVIFGENEAGKSTVCEFIKAMFYGTGKRAAGQSMSVRERYTPWDGSPAGGRIYFEHSGREFFIEREFRKSDATDKVTITDIATGKSEACPSDIGKTLFGISVGAFERSVFIGNIPKFSAESGADELNQKLSNAAFTGEDSVSYAKVLKRLDDARFKLISKSGRTGSRVSDIQERDRLSGLLEETDLAARKKQEILTAVKSNDEKLLEIEKKCEEASRVLLRAQDIENAQKLKEYIELKDKLDRLNSELSLADGTVADEMFLKKLDFGFSKLNNIEEKINTYKSELQALQNAAQSRQGLSADEIRQKIEEADAQKRSLLSSVQESEEKILSLEKEAESSKENVEKAKSAKKKFNVLLFSIGISAAVLGVILYFFAKSIMLSAVVCIIGIIAVILSFVLRPADKSALADANIRSEKKQSELSTAKSELTVIKGEINNLDSRIENLNVSLNFGVNEEQRIEETKRRISECALQIEDEKKKFLEFFALPADTDLSALKARAEALSIKADEQKKIKLRLTYLSRDLGGISYEEARMRLSETGEVTDIDIQEQKETAQRLLDRKSELREIKARLETELKTAFRNMLDPEDLRREIETYDEKIDAKKEYFDAATVAREVLEESLNTARKSFGGVLESETLKNLKAMTSDAYSFITVSDEFDITAQRSGTFGAHEIEYLSRGAKDQAYLALRLAISKLITDKEPLPVILDDALSQYDDKRFLLALEFLKKYGEKNQVLLFTCHNFVTEAAKQKNIKVSKI